MKSVKFDKAILLPTARAEFSYVNHLQNISHWNFERRDAIKKKKKQIMTPYNAITIPTYTLVFLPALVTDLGIACL